MAWDDQGVGPRLEHHIPLERISHALLQSRLDVEHAHAALMLFLQPFYCAIDKDLLQMHQPWEAEWLKGLEGTSLSDAQIRREDLNALIGRKTWLTDESINLYGQALTLAAPTVYCFSSHFHTLACTKGKAYVRSWLRHLKEEHQTIIIPININNCHWVSCCIYLPALLFCGFDSMGVFSKDLVQEVLSTFLMNKDYLPFSIQKLIDDGHLLVRDMLRPLKDISIVMDDSDASYEEQNNVGEEKDSQEEKEEEDNDNEDDDDDDDVISISDSTTSEPSTIQLEEMKTITPVLFPPPERVEPISSELVQELWELSSYQDRPEGLDDDLRRINESINTTVFGTLFITSSKISKPSSLKLRTLILAFKLIEQKAGRYRDLCRYIHLMRRYPLQRNGYDCGVYTLYFMRLCAGHALGFGLSDALSGIVRSLCAWEIIGGKLGLPKKSIF